MPATGAGQSQEAINNLADRLFAAVEQGDVATLDRMFDDDIAVWRPGARCDNDKNRAMRVLLWFVDVTAERSYEILDRRLFSDGFVQQHILHAAGRNGGSIAMRVCIVVRLGDNDLISRIDEYFDPTEVAPLLG